MEIPFWFLFSLFGALSIVLISGHGNMLISGYNTENREEKPKYNEKKLGKVVGSSMAVMAILFLIMALLDLNNISSSVIYYMLIVVIVIICSVTVVLCNTICRK